MYMPVARKFMSFAASLSTNMVDTPKAVGSKIHTWVGMILMSKRHRDIGESGALVILIAITPDVAGKT